MQLLNLWRPMLQFPKDKQYEFIAAPDSHRLSVSREAGSQKEDKQERFDDAADFVRDLTYALENLDSFACKK